MGEYRLEGESEVTETVQEQCRYSFPLESVRMIGNDSPINCLAISKDNRWLVCGDNEERVWIFERFHQFFQRIIVEIDTHL
jgi:hypothetical protein